jgi:hypothetical protein
MRCDTDASAARVQAFDQPQQAVDAVNEPPLLRQRLGAAEAARLVEHRQQRQADAGALRGATSAAPSRPARHRAALRVVVHVVELAHRGVAGRSISM